MNSILIFIVALGLLIFVHEFGHFLFAKLFGVRVERFSLGFGPKLLGKRWGETEYLISAFPLGGYVKMFGEQRDNDDAASPEAHRSFSHKPVWQRFLIVFAGPFFNLLFAVFLFFLIFAVAGLPQLEQTTEIGQVQPDLPAAAIGLEPGDVILGMDGRQIERWEEISEVLQRYGGDPVQVTVRRGEEVLTFTAKPVSQETKNIFGEVVGARWLLGISRPEKIYYEEVSFFRAMEAALAQTWGFIYLTVMGIIKILQRVVPATELGGPILIAQMTGQQMEAGWLNLIHFLGLLSVNLGILNLLPIPILDGGHLVFFTMEAIKRKPLALRTQEMWQQLGLMLLAALMIFVFYNDLVRIFTSG
jgi:regulator of sigma E protease